MSNVRNNLARHCTGRRGVTNRARHCTGRRGSAAIFAISLIILVGAALVALGAHFSMEAKRTQSQSDGAQLRQLLTAGAAAAIARADTPSEAKPLELPADLTSQGASVTIAITGEGETRTATLAAKFGERKLDETLQLKRENNRWTVVAIVP